MLAGADLSSGVGNLRTRVCVCVCVCVCYMLCLVFEGQRFSPPDWFLSSLISLSLSFFFVPASFVIRVRTFSRWPFGFPYVAFFPVTPRGFARLQVWECVCVCSADRHYSFCHAETRRLHGSLMTLSCFHTRRLTDVFTPPPSFIKHNQLF